MKEIITIKLSDEEAALWFLGQAGYIIRSLGKTVVIDPYLSDSAGKATPDFSRAVPIPLPPEELKADIFVTTHDHLDHLDPDTISRYKHKNATVFIAPRLACRKLESLGVNPTNIRRIDSGESLVVENIQFTGIYAIPNEPSVIDTCGYKIEFENGRSLYHTADTGFSELLMQCVPKAELLLVCINGKWGNMDAMEAAALTRKMKPLIAIPNHYDVMALNSENPESFRFFIQENDPDLRVEILEIMKPIIW